MAEGALSIKLRCASWQQLATIYKRDLSQGTMFLRATTPPAIGTSVRIDLALPSATVIALTGVVRSHVNDPQRGAGVELKLAPIPTGSVWLIESALASEHKRLAAPVQATPIRGPHQMTGIIPTIPMIPAIHDSADLTAAEQDLIKALVSEAESLKKLNPFLVLGVGYEATDVEVRAAFGELTKRYHPDRFARYESAELRQVATEIFILIRDAYRRLGDAAARAQLLQALGKPAPAPRALPGPPRATPPVPPPRGTPRAPVPTSATSVPAVGPAATVPIGSVVPTVPIALTVPAAPAAEVTPAAPAAPRPVADARRGRPQRSSELPTLIPGGEPRGGLPTRAANDPLSHPSHPSPVMPTTRRSRSSSPPPMTTPATLTSEPLDVSPLEALIDQGRLDEALAGYTAMAKKHPHDRNLRAGVELCEGLHALAARDRLEAAQRFEAALEIDPSNERAARELADMRRQATNERKGLLSRLMGKKEP